MIFCFNAAEWTSTVDIRERKIPSSGKSKYGLSPIFWPTPGFKLKGRTFDSSDTQQRGPWFLCPQYPTAGRNYEEGTVSDFPVLVSVVSNDWRTYFDGYICTGNWLKLRIKGMSRLPANQSFHTAPAVPHEQCVTCYQTQGLAFIPPPFFFFRGGGAGRSSSVCMCACGGGECACVCVFMSVHVCVCALCVCI